MMEANKWAFRSVGHKCDAPDANGVYPNCDRGGRCHIDLILDVEPKTFGPGRDYKINT